MLRYSIKLDKPNTEFNEIPYESIFYSNDLSYISGVTTSENGIVNGQDVYIQFNDSTEFSKYKIEVKSVVRRGYISPSNNTFVTKIFSDTDFSCYKRNDGVEVVKYTSGNYRCYCDDNNIYFNGNNYTVNFNIDSTVEINNSTIEITNSDLTEVQKIFYFFIRKDTDKSFNLDNIKCAKKITLNNVEQWANVEYSNKLHLYLKDNNLLFRQSDIINVYSVDSNVECCKVFTENGTPKILLYGKKYNVNSSIDYIVINNNEYELKYVTKNNKKYGYYIQDNKTKVVEISDDTLSATTLCDSISTNFSTTHIINKYKYVNIDGVNFLLTKIGKYTFDTQSNELVYDSNNEEEVVYITLNKPLKLIIDEVETSNCLRCSIYNTDYNELSESICYMLYKNKNKFNFQLEKQLFSNSLIDYKSSDEKEEYKYSFITTHLYNPNRYYNLPVKIDTKTDNNLHQEQVIKEQFFKKEVEKSINKIVDMEKDVYYPYFVNGDTLVPINEIIFDLHFRTRDENWNIIDNEYITGDTYVDYRSNWNIFDNYILEGLGWDGNNRGLKPIIKVNDNSSDINQEFSSYYQPSDLLGFLNFSDRDVFYQKKKLSKSFLRLSFYDSNNPKNQSLLHTSTIFINEGGLYKKFIEHRNKQDYFMSVEYIENIEDRIYDDMISVIDEDIDKETYDSGKIATTNPTVIIDENKRLSSRIKVKNRYESDESSEGFYLYMFKEYSEGLHEKTIYMKVEFNHAGEGRTLNMFMPTQGSGTTKELYNFYGKIDDFCKGIPLSGLYESMFIELKCRYDINEKKYIYYLPSSYVKHDVNEKMRFNLYEIKIRDEIKHPINENN